MNGSSNSNYYSPANIQFGNGAAGGWVASTSPSQPAGLSTKVGSGLPNDDASAADWLEWASLHA